MPARTKPASVNLTDASAQEGIDFILSSVRDPFNVRHCGRCLYGALLASTSSSDLPYDTPRFTQTTGIVKNQTFWDHLLGFMVMKRTDKQLERLIVRLSQCNCKLSDKKIQYYHETGKIGEPGTMSRGAMEFYAPQGKKHLYSAERCALVIKVFCLLFSAISESGVKSVAKGVGRRWPNHAADLVPFGPDELVQSLLQWYRFVPDTIVFSLLGAITRVCRFLITPSLLKFQVCHLIAESTRESVDIIREQLKEVYNTETTPCILFLFSRASKYEYTVRGFIDFFEAVETMPMDVRAALMFGCETKLMQLCSIMAYLTSDPRFLTIGPDPNVKDVWFFVRSCQQIFRLYHMHLYPRPNMPLHPRVVELDEKYFPPPDNVRSTDESVISFISDFRQDQRCSAYHCTNSLQSVGKAFQRCGRCHIVAYCSRECQTTSWKQEEHPHKRICPLLCNLVDKAGGLGIFIRHSPQSHNNNNSNGKVHVQYPIIENYLDWLQYICLRWKAAGVPKDDLEQVCAWGKSYYSIRIMPHGLDWNPGYEDYDAVIAELSQPIGPGPKRM